jgi:hypothetical protein
MIPLVADDEEDGEDLEADLYREQCASLLFDFDDLDE